MKKFIFFCNRGNLGTIGYTYFCKRTTIVTYIQGGCHQFYYIHVIKCHRRRFLHNFCRNTMQLPTLHDLDLKFILSFSHVRTRTFFSTKLLMYFYNFITYCVLYIFSITSDKNKLKERYNFKCHKTVS